jgi:S-DNA-T family DNA segregation ATPase FtsK/SpoIIIE
VPGQLKNRDELYEAAVDIVVRERRGSVSLLQRCLGIGYGRAARLIDFMAEDGIVGEYNGSQAREVVISIEDWEAMQSGAGQAPGPPTAPGAAGNVPQLPVRRPNKVLPDTDEPSDIEDDAAPSSVVGDEDYEYEDGVESELDAEYEEEYDEELAEDAEAECAPASAAKNADRWDEEYEDEEYTEEPDSPSEWASGDEDLWNGNEDQVKVDRLADTA